MAGKLDRFTQRARRVLTLAQEEAERMNHNYIGTEHLLLGLVREGTGVAARVLLYQGITEEKVVKSEAEWRKRLGKAKVGIFGHSWGTLVAMALALDFPQVVEKLVLASTNFGGPHHVPVTQEAMTVLMDLTSDPLTRFKNGLGVSTAPGWADKNPDMIQQWVEWRVANPIDPAAYNAQLAIGLGLIPEAAAFESQLPRIQAPTLILSGAHDKVVPPQNASLLAEKIPGSKVVIFPDAGHFFPIEIPEAASKAVIEFAA